MLISKPYMLHCYHNILFYLLYKKNMSFNLCNLPRQEKYLIQLDYEASFWAFKVKRGKSTRDQIYSAILQRPQSEQGELKQRFERYLATMS